MGDYTVFLSSAVVALFSVVMSLAVELIPPFAVWWDRVPLPTKRSVRGWVGLALSIAVTLYAYYSGMYTFDVSSTESVLNLALSVLTGWTSFVLGGETTYQTAYHMLPRKK